VMARMARMARWRDGAWAQLARWRRLNRVPLSRGDVAGLRVFDPL
jgi:hypothetical protein